MNLNALHLHIRRTNAATPARKKTQHATNEQHKRNIVRSSGFRDIRISAPFLQTADRYGAASFLASVLQISYFGRYRVCSMRGRACQLKGDRAATGYTCISCSALRVVRNMPCTVICVYTQRYSNHDTLHVPGSSYRDNGIRIQGKEIKDYFYSHAAGNHRSGAPELEHRRSAEHQRPVACRVDHFRICHLPYHGKPIVGKPAGQHADDVLHIRNRFGGVRTQYGHRRWNKTARRRIPVEYDNRTCNHIHSHTEHCADKGCEKRRLGGDVHTRFGRALDCPHSGHTVFRRGFQLPHDNRFHTDNVCRNTGNLK